MWYLRRNVQHGVNKDAWEKQNSKKHFPFHASFLICYFYHLSYAPVPNFSSLLIHFYLHLNLRVSLLFLAFVSFPWALALCQVLYTILVHIFLHPQWQIPCTSAPSRIFLLFQFSSSVFSCFSRLLFVSSVYFFLLTLCCYAFRKWHRRALFSANL